jgi:isopentenyldiphosphate isomerase
VSAPILIVDKHDRPVGKATKQEAWEKGLYHRIVRIVLENADGKILLQHRSPTKDLYPNCWDISSAGHVDAGEDYLEAAYRELKEELGISGITLAEIGSFLEEHTWQGHQLNRFVKVYKATVTDTPKSHEPHKIDDVRWWTAADIKKLLTDEPEHTADGLQEVFGRYYSGRR